MQEKRTRRAIVQRRTICVQQGLGKAESFDPSQRKEDSDMNFQNVNSLNMNLNKLSGNLLPMTDRGSSFTLFWKLYGIFVTVIQLLMTIVLICGCIHVSRSRFVHDGMIVLSTTGEVMFMTIQIHVRQDLVRQLIRRFNSILQDVDENLRNIVRRMFKATQVPLAFYAIAGAISAILWTTLPLLTFEKKSVYWNEDYKIPSFFPNEPYSRRTFILCYLLLASTSVYRFLRKVSVDVYMIHLVLLLTAQYRYIRVKTAMIFREGTEQEHVQEKSSSEVNRTQERKMIELCRYHNAVIE